jgi:hypothetical protein
MITVFRTEAFEGFDIEEQALGNRKNHGWLIGTMYAATAGKRKALRLSVSRRNAL